MQAPIKKKVLVVDDEPESRIFLENLLDANGFWPIVAGDDHEGLHKAAFEDPAVIILNVMMPSDAGVILYRRLKQNDQLRDIPLIMLSTIERDTFLRCYPIYRPGSHEAALVCEPYLEKPVESELLLGHVRRLVSLQDSKTQKPAPEPDPMRA